MLVSCGDDEEEEWGDKTQLNALIERADSLANSATTADYPQSAIDDFKNVIQTVKDAAAGNLTETQITNLMTQLQEAINTFESRAYSYIDENLYLIAGWHFDEGTGTTAKDYSKNTFVGISPVEQLPF
jgi:uncharacterized membrane protein YheB (UPF0754 family)